MIDIAVSRGGPGTGLVEIWLETVDRQKFLLARGDDALEALIDAEKLLRAELDVVQARLHAVRHTLDPHLGSP
jgi:hypothetical protein